LKLITAQEVAKIMDCAESTIRTNAAKGTLGFPAVKVGKLWKFRDEEVYEYVYGKDWKRIVFGIVGEEPSTPETSVPVAENVLRPAQPKLVMDPEPVAEPEPEPQPKPVPMSARPVNVIPLGAQEVKFEE
jgi:excisionase family DNA binding protein